jgi:hypothetical protein
VLTPGELAGGAAVDLLARVPEQLEELGGDTADQQDTADLANLGGTPA